MDCPFTFLMVSFETLKVLNFDDVQFICFFFFSLLVPLMSYLRNNYMKSVNIYKYLFFKTLQFCLLRLAD